MMNHEYTPHGSHGGQDNTNIDAQILQGKKYAGIAYGHYRQGEYENADYWSAQAGDLIGRYTMGGMELEADQHSREYAETIDGALTRLIDAGLTDEDAEHGRSQFASHIVLPTGSAFERYYVRLARETKGEVHSTGMFWQSTTYSDEYNPATIQRVLLPPNGYPAFVIPGDNTLHELAPQGFSEQQPSLNEVKSLIREIGSYYDVDMKDLVGEEEDVPGYDDLIARQCFSVGLNKRDMTLDQATLETAEALSEMAGSVVAPRELWDIPEIRQLSVEMGVHPMTAWMALGIASERDLANPAYLEWLHQNGDN